MPEALPAVTKPSLSNAVGSPARSSIVVSGTHVVVLVDELRPLPLPHLDRRDLLAIVPAAHASPASCCERMANWSCSSRLMP